MADYANLMEWVVTQNGPVATIKFGTVSKPLDEFIEHHVSLALALEKVRFDDSVRVVIITGRDDTTTKERRALSFAGHIAVTVVLDERGRPLVDPVVVAAGVPTIAVESAREAAAAAIDRLGRRRLDDDRAIEEGEVGPECGELAGMGEQRPYAVRDQVDGRLMARDQQQGGHAAQFGGGQLVAVLAGGADERAQQVVAR